MTSDLAAAHDDSAPLDRPQQEESRSEAAVLVARTLSVLWVLPSVFLCGALAYLGVLSVTFFSYALSGDEPLPVRPVLVVLGVSALLLTTMIVLGLLTSRAVARWLARREALVRVPVWVVSVTATLVAAAVAATVPLTVLAVQAWW